MNVQEEIAALEKRLAKLKKKELGLVDYEDVELHVFGYSAMSKDYASSQDKVLLTCPHCPWIYSSAATLLEATAASKEHALKSHPESTVAIDAAREKARKDRWENPPLGHHFVHNEYDYDCSFPGCGGSVESH